VRARVLERDASSLRRAHVVGEVALSEAYYEGR